jgi:lipopolysaccharide biosynthesis glycosyltransferase
VSSPSDVFLRRLRRFAGRVLPARAKAAIRAGLRPADSARPTRAAAPGSAATSRAGDQRRYAINYWNLARAELGADLESSHPDEAPYDAALVSQLSASVTRHRNHAVLAEALQQGRGLEDAVVAAVRELARPQAIDDAWALTTGVERLPGGELAARLGRACMLHRQRRFTRSWAELAQVDPGLLARHLPLEAVDGALATGTDEARAAARAIVDPSHLPLLSVGDLVGLAGRFLAMGEESSARSLVAEARTRDTSTLTEKQSRSLALTTYWLGHPGHDIPEGALPVAVIDYQSPDQDLASGNVGDYVQTLALLGNMARLSDVQFTGEHGLGELVTDLQARVRPELRHPGVTGSIHLIEVNREFSGFDPVPPDTWMVAFGWHMHPLYQLRYDFPYHSNINPLFASFHVSRIDMLTDEALEYLRTYGPVGCRDWTTVYLLLSAGVDAFFTGCMTSTVDAVFPPREQVRSSEQVVGVVDLRERSAGKTTLPIEVHTHQANEFRHMNLVAGVRAASRMLADYQSRFQRAVTMRLHAYLPLTALGVPVTFRPPVAGDARFPGLSGLTPGDPDLTLMQDGIRSLLAETLGAAVEGATTDEVYALWRRLTADAVATAKARFAAPVAVQPTTMDVATSVAGAWAASSRFGPHEELAGATGITDVVLAFDQNLTRPAAVMLESMVDNASGPLRLWVLTRGIDESYQKWLAHAFPAVPMTFVPFDHVDYGAVGRLRGRITMSTMDRLLVPELLADVDRVVYLDVDTLVLADIGDLAQSDLDGHPVAARDSVVSGAREWRIVGRRLPEDLSLEIQRRMGERHGYRCPALNAGVLVMDLARMRADRFTRTYLGWVERYGLDDQDVMLAYAGSDRQVLPPAWNALPYLEPVEQPKVVHWAQGGKPWSAQLAPFADLWRTYDARVRARVGAPPE